MLCIGCARASAATKVFEATVHLGPPPARLGLLSGTVATLPAVFCRRGAQTTDRTAAAFAGALEAAEAIMTPENKQRLRAKHPHLLAKPTGNATCRFDEDGVAVDDGWFGTVDDLATEIEQACSAAGTPLPNVLQVKEKLGTLRFYVRGASDDVHAIIERAVERSPVTCEACGAAGNLRRRPAHALRRARYAAVVARVTALRRPNGAFRSRRRFC